jgi:hypothetical protein
MPTFQCGAACISPGSECAQLRVVVKAHETLCVNRLELSIQQLWWWDFPCAKGDTVPFIAAKKEINAGA